MIELVADDPKSQAILIYLNRGRSPFPRSDASAVIHAFPAKGVELAAYAEGVRSELRSLPVDWSSETYEQACERVESEVARRHPELNREAIDAIGWAFCYDWK